MYVNFIWKDHTLKEDNFLRLQTSSTLEEHSSYSRADVRDQQLYSSISVRTASTSTASAPSSNTLTRGGNSRTCPICNRTFYWPNEVAIHMRTHTGERPFPCQHCPYRATQSGALKRHVLAKHADK